MVDEMVVSERQYNAMANEESIVEAFNKRIADKKEGQSPWGHTDTYIPTAPGAGNLGKIVDDLYKALNVDFSGEPHSTQRNMQAAAFFQEVMELVNKYSAKVTPRQVITED